MCNIYSQVSGECFFSSIIVRKTRAILHKFNALKLDARRNTLLFSSITENCPHCFSFRCSTWFSSVHSNGLHHTTTYQMKFLWSNTEMFSLFWKEFNTNGDMFTLRTRCVNHQSTDEHNKSNYNRQTKRKVTARFYVARISERRIRSVLERNELQTNLYEQRLIMKIRISTKFYIIQVSCRCTYFITRG